MTTTTYSYSASVAVALGEGEITGIGRIWADGKPLDATGITWRLYKGDETQTPDAFITAKMGAGNVPAYRGTAYAVFEELPLEAFGNRIPQLSFEVFAPIAEADTAEGMLRAVTLIPGSGEFVYATTPISAGTSGTSSSQNVHSTTGEPDIVTALDQLQASLPNIESVSLVVSWFGTDLRAGNCQIKPGVESASKATTPRVWVVNGETRASAYLILPDAGGDPAYGGTPADFAVVEAIQELTARGLRVTLSPFILMDVPAGNTLPNPYSEYAAAVGQPTYPWRGRITCSPAPGYVGAAEASAEAATQVGAFFGAATSGDFTVSGEAVSWSGTAGEWGYRRMILHYACLCTAAGGVDSFLIGSELRGLTTTRGDCMDPYPAVTALKQLAADVSGILGAATQVGYAAGWSEYHSHRFDEPFTELLKPEFVGTILSAPLVAGWLDPTPSRKLLPDYTHWRLNAESNSGVDPSVVTLGQRVAWTTIGGAANFHMVCDIDVSSLQIGETLAYGDQQIADIGNPAIGFNDIIELAGYTQADLDAIDASGDYLAGSGTRLATRNQIDYGDGTISRALSYTLDRSDLAMVRMIARLEDPLIDRTVWYQCPSFRVDRPSSTVAFNLDPLWSDANIDFIGIDNYMAVSDWRDGTSHLDALAGWPDIHDRAYLQSNIEGGEYFDWYYASDADRDVQMRTAISDGAYGKPWVFRQKDIRNWWANPHYDRPSGIENPASTAWVPGSKPIRFTEFGCPAIDRGTNQPNVFVDPKSSESAVPHHSRGWRDDAIQRSYLEATLGYWGDSANNPTSGVYGAPMIDLGRAAAWTWDARPYPDFPARTDIWADAGNWQLGHWLNGRIGAAGLGALVRALCARAGLDDALIDVSDLGDSASGFVISALESPRASISVLARHFGFDAAETGGLIRFVPRGRASVATIAPDDMVAGQGAGSGTNSGDVMELVRGQETELPQALKWQVVRADEEYDTATAEARRVTVTAARVASETFPLAVPLEEADRRARRALMEAWVGREALTARLPPSKLALDTGDVVSLAHDGRLVDYRLARIADAGARAIEAVRVDAAIYDLPPGQERGARLPGATVYGPANVVLMDLPQLDDTTPAHRPWAAVFARPWYGAAAIWRSATTSGFTLLDIAPQPARIGTLAADLPAGPVGRWDLANTLSIDLTSGALASVSDLDLFAGANTLAIEAASGQWEILQAGTATLVATGRYDLTRLLRGQRGTGDAMGDPAPAGARVVLLDAALQPLSIAEADIGIDWNWRIGPANAAPTDTIMQALVFTPSGRGLMPFSPVHPRLRREVNGDLSLRWIRRDRARSADSWVLAEVPMSESAESYDLEIMSGASVVRTIKGLTTPGFTWTTAMQNADIGGPVTSVDLRITQIGALGRGVPLATILSISEST